MKRPEEFPCPIGTELKDFTCPGIFLEVGLAGLRVIFYTILHSYEYLQAFNNYFIILQKDISPHIQGQTLLIMTDILLQNLSFYDALVGY